MVGDAEDLVDTSLATAVQGREHSPESEGSRRQHEILHTRVNRGTGLKSSLAGGWRVDAGDDQHRCGREWWTHPTRHLWPVPVGGAPGLLVYLADCLLYSLVADRNEMPGLGVGAGGAVDRGGQDLIDECVRDLRIGEGADGALVAKQLMHIGDRLHGEPPCWSSPHVLPLRTVREPQSVYQPARGGPLDPCSPPPAPLFPR